MSSNGSAIFLRLVKNSDFWLKIIYEQAEIEV